MVVARASGTDLASSLKQNTFLGRKTSQGGVTTTPLVLLRPGGHPATKKSPLQPHVCRVVSTVDPLTTLRGKSTRDDQTTPLPPRAGVMAPVVGVPPPMGCR